MKAIFNSKSFWIAAIIMAIIFFIVGAISSKTYKGEMKILLLPRSEVAARNIDQILRNAEEIPKSLSFYDKMLQLNPDIEDEFANMPDDQRKKSWNSKIKTDNVKRSGIIKINAFDETELQAGIISRQIALSDIAVLSKYYDITTDLDMRIIDGPIVYSVYKINFWTLFLLSLLSGAVVGCAIYFIVKFFPKKEDFFRLESMEKYFKSSVKGDEKEAPEYFSIPEEDLASFEDVYAFEKKGSAPENLPIADESIFIPQAKEIEAAVQQKSSENISRIVTREATPEEVKARLNKLLNS